MSYVYNVKLHLPSAVFWTRVISLLGIRLNEEFPSDSNYTIYLFGKPHKHANTCFLIPLVIHYSPKSVLQSNHIFRKRLIPTIEFGPVWILT